MTKKIISILLACLMILPIALVPAFAEEAETAKTYNLTELNDSVVLQPGDTITWEGEEISQYLAVTYVTNPDPFSTEDDQSSAAPVASGGSFTIQEGNLFESPDEKLSFAGWKVEEVKVKSSGVSELTLSAVWGGNDWDHFVFTLTCFFKPVLGSLLGGLLDFIVEIAKIFA